ncbi:MAG: hypothetical protein JEZ01_03155 [Labilibaculum sp.]|nr:hypothetical protein [Labilibaculum sp.]MBI9056750.1 hypothetical protein [Labilibaculum sp.]
MSEIHTIDSLKSLDKTIYSITGRIQLNNITDINTNLLLDIGDFNSMIFVGKLRKEYANNCISENLKNQFKDELELRLDLIMEILYYGARNLEILKTRQNTPDNYAEIMQLFDDVIINVKNCNKEKYQRYNTYCAKGNHSDPFIKILSQCVQWRTVGGTIEAFINNNFNEIASLSESEVLEDSNPDNIGKIVMLHELGILDFLKSKLPNNFSEADLGSLINSFTGINSGTAKRYINGIKNRDKNNPLKKNNINSVRGKLTELGLNDIFNAKQ